MEDKQEANPEDENTNSEKLLSPTTNEHIDVVEGEPKTETSTVKTDYIKNERVNVIVNVPEQDNTIGVAANQIAAKSNRIAFYSICVNVVLAGLTYFLWREAINATKTASDSLKETQKAVNEAVRSNNIAERNFNLSKAVFDSTISSGKEASANAKQSFELQQKSVEAQIQSIKETQKQFTVSNEPFLQIKEAKMVFEKDVIINIVIENLGRYPAQIKSARLKILPGSKNAKPTFSKLFSEYTKATSSVNIYLINGSPSEMEAGRKINTSKKDFQKYMINKSLYILVSLEYINLVNNRVRKYNAIVEEEIEPVAVKFVSFKYLKNENTYPE